MVAIGSFVEEGVEKVEDVAVVSVVFLLVGFILLERADPLLVECIFGDFLQNLYLA